MPGVCDNPVILNLHLLLWDSYIAQHYVRPPIAAEGRRLCCGYPPSFARSQSTGNGTLGFCFVYKDVLVVLCNERKEKMVKFKRLFALLMITASLSLAPAASGFAALAVNGDTTVESETDSQVQSESESETQEVPQSETPQTDNPGNIGAGNGSGIVGGTTAPQGIVPGNVKKLKAKSTSSYVQLTWKKAKNAVKYEIHTVDSKTNQTHKIATTKKTTYKIKDLVPNQDYMFQVFAVNNKGGVVNLSAQGSPIAKGRINVAKPAVPTNFHVSVVGDKSLTLKWNKAKNATGYYLYMYNDKTGKYEQIKKTRSTTLKISGLKDGKLCRFKVQSYRTVGKYNVTSKKSKEVSEKAHKFTKLAKQVHGRYYNTTVKSTTKATQVKNGKKIRVKAGTKVVATTLSGSSVTAMMPDGTKIKISPKVLRFTSLNTTKTSYSKEVKEAFVNQKRYSSPTNYLIWISQYTLETTIFKGSTGKWKAVRSMPCVIGAMGRTTPGTFRLLRVEYDYGGPVIYFSWNSVKQWGNSFHRYVDGNRQGAYSHGCVRLSDADLYYIKNNCPMGTTVVSY